MSYLEKLKSSKAVSQRKRSSLLWIMEENVEARLDSIIERIKEHEIAVSELDFKISATEKAIEALEQPIESLNRLHDEYNYFWRCWIDLKYKDRRRAIQTPVKEFRLFAESDTDYI